MTKKQEHIVIIGTGKVAHHLGLHLKKNGHLIKYVWGRDFTKAQKLSKTLETNVLKSLNTFPNDCLAMVCVADFAISEVISQLPSNIKIAYTSGSIRIEDLPTKKYLGVFYPLQTFSQNKSIDISKVPFLIEANEIEFQNDLKALGETLSSKVIIANSQDRYNTHIGAVLVNNFTNFLYHLAQQHLNEHNLDFDLLKPLIKETVEKLNTLSPIEAQTGPAARGDTNIIEKHINSIQNPQTKQLYRLFSELIDKEINK
ncbi:Rossmann-like and DUF2520 domain-containing protein [Brumimicrobium mesophilum]|uniref:Rossmann-like and DUF2520 domain-containing protein n=1 Tax=Brumimicrobium mesophilum TaxID=392717 RepID=UPI000D13F6D6|nr:DUF2520 domain-containing protein [Brumimicrobium mesophilum]